MNGSLPNNISLVDGLALMLVIGAASLFQGRQVTHETPHSLFTSVSDGCSGAGDPIHVDSVSERLWPVNAMSSPFG
jgi:hypothetical protein